MSDTTGYNGWTNYETWAVKLWMDNEEGSYNYVREMAREVIEDTAEETHAYWTNEENQRFTFADRLKDEYEDAMPELDGPWCDLLRGAFSEVNWEEIAENILSDLREDATV